MNARALFSLYFRFICTFFSLILTFFSELANHSRESIQRPTLFSCLFSSLFQSGAQPRPQGLLLDDFQNGGSTGEDSGQH